MEKKTKYEEEYDLMMKTKAEAEYQLIVSILLSGEGINSFNKMGLNNYEIYNILKMSIQYFIEDENYEMCAEINNYLNTDEMIEIKDHFHEYTKAYRKNFN